VELITTYKDMEYLKVAENDIKNPTIKNLARTFFNTYARLQEKYEHLYEKKAKMLKLLFTF